MIGTVGASSRMEDKMEKLDWNTAVEKYLDRRAKKTGDDWPKYEAQEKGYCRRLSEALGDNPSLQDIDDDRVLDVTEHLRQGRKAATVNRHLVVLRRILRLGVTWRWYEKVPAEVELLEEDTPNRRFLTKEEARKLIHECKGQLRDKVIVALGTGLRDANIKGLRWDWCDMSNRSIRVPKEFLKGKRGKRTDLHIPMSDEVFSVLKKISRRTTKHPELVFPYDGKIVYRSGTGAFRRARQRAGVPWCKWHTLRHTWASWKIQDKVPPIYIQRMGGWASPKMLGIYAHLDVEHMRDYQNTNFLAG